MEEGIDQGGEEGVGKGDQQPADHQAAAHSQRVQGGSDLIDVLPPPGSDLPADDDGGGAAHGEDSHGIQILNVARQGPGGQNFSGILHMAHDHLVHGGAQAPQGFVEHHRTGIAEELLDQGPSRPEHEGGLELEPLVGEGVGHSDAELQNTGEQGGEGGALHPQGGGAQVAEDEHPVEEGVGGHGGGKDDHAQFGVLHGAVGPHIHAGEAVKEVGGSHNAGVAGGQGDQLLIVGEQSHELGGEKAHDDGKQSGNSSCHIAADADDPVDGVGVLLAPELADEHRGAALQAEDHQLDDKYRQVGLRNGGQRGLAQRTHHKGIHQPQQGGTQVLQQDGQGQ